MFLLLAPFATASPCSSAAIRTIRIQAHAALDHKNPTEAVRLLTQVTCALYDPDILTYAHELAWARSDLAYAYRIAGNPAQCYSIAERNFMPQPDAIAPLLDEDDRAVRALAANARACKADLEAGWGVFEAGPCGWQPGAVGIPDRPSGPACLTVATPVASSDPICPVLTLVTRQPDGALRQTPLTLDPASELADPSVCCHIQSVTFQRHDDGLRVRISGDGRDCWGGTAYSEEVAVYALQGQTLRWVAGYDSEGVAHVR
jgi:hypothetical protein